MPDIFDTLQAEQRSVAELTTVSVKLSWIQDAIRAIEDARDQHAALFGHIGDIVDDIARGALVNAAEIGDRLANLTAWPIDGGDPLPLPVVCSCGESPAAETEDGDDALPS